MQLEVGQIVEGKITGITKFGAFVSLSDGKSGLVHISEVANTYVSDVSSHVSEGESVNVKIIGISPDGKINLSIKKALPDERPAMPHQPRQPARGNPTRGYPTRGSNPAASPSEPSFEDKLKQFMQDADSRISGNRHFSDKKSSSRKRRD